MSFSSRTRLRVERLLLHLLLRVPPPSHSLLSFFGSFSLSSFFCCCCCCIFLSFSLSFSGEKVTVEGEEEEF